LKKELINLDLVKINLLCKIKEEMKKFIPGPSERKSKPQLNGDVFTFSYYGVGKWSNSKMDQTDLENIKSNFKSFLSKYKWSEKVLVSIYS
jgi:hypothetical protein